MYAAEEAPVSLSAWAYICNIYILLFLSVCKYFLIYIFFFFFFFFFGEKKKKKKKEEEEEGKDAEDAGVMPTVRAARARARARRA